MTNKILVYFLIQVISLSAHAQTDTAAAARSQIDNVKNNPPQPTPAEKLIVNLGPGRELESCRQTVSKAVNECMKPSGFGFKEAAQIGLMLPGVAASFMGGSDAGKMAEMCQITQGAAIVSSMLNNAQDRTCEHASAACQTMCGHSRKVFEEQIGVAIRNDDVSGAELARHQEKLTTDADKECQDKVGAQMQLAKQQQMANQAPTAGSAACDQALNSDDDLEDDEIVDCSLAQYANYSQCATIGKTDDGSGIPFEPGLNLTNDDEAIDLPEGEDREDFWNALKNKTAGAGGRSGGGAGAGAMGGGPGGGNGSGGNRAGGPMRKSGSSMVTGGNESSGGGAGWGKGDDGDFDKKFAKLGAKTNGLNMLKKKKIGGRNVASSEFGVASDDIWTRVYLRTNTRCTKQLAECAANKSLNPYGVINKAR